MTTVHTDIEHWFFDPTVVAILLLIALAVWSVRNWLRSRHLR